MKATKILSIVSLLLVIAVFASCGAKQTVSVWDSAVYSEDAALGEGAKTVTLTVSAEEKSVTFTLNTDRENLGDALKELNLIDGEEGEFGLYVNVVNGITADFDTDGTYWSLFLNGEATPYGVDSAAISGGEIYEFRYTK